MNQENNHILQSDGLKSAKNQPNYNSTKNEPDIVIFSDECSGTQEVEQSDFSKCCTLINMGLMCAVIVTVFIIAMVLFVNKRYR